jgi:hypothetical protein
MQRAIDHRPVEIVHQPDGARGIGLALHPLDGPMPGAVQPAETARSVALDERRIQQAAM